jgi:hypothetical protein
MEPLVARMLHLDPSLSLRAEAVELSRMADEEVRHPATANHLRRLAGKCLRLAEELEGRRGRSAAPRAVAQRQESVISCG